MNSHLRGIYGLASAFALTVALTGCATYEKCGFNGCAGDEKITQNVKTLFDEHPELGPPNSIDVQTLDRVVYLNGMAATGLEKREAESVAHDAPGAAEIVNLISVAH